MPSRSSLWLTLTVALVLTGAALAAAWLWLRPSGPPLAAASLSLDSLSPNADGREDVTRITYQLRRPATVSIYFTDAAGTRYDFRRDRPRASGESAVDFSGVVDPYRLPGEDFPAEVLARVLQDGAYTWVVEARDAAGVANTISGPLTVQGADTTLPLVEALTVGPKLFTPNQDGLDDRVTINVAINKDLPPANLRTTLIGPGGLELPIGESANSPKAPGQAGVHEYNYDGGVDQGQSPPPEGEYVIRAVAEDALGQRTALTETLMIALRGLPRAEIVQGRIEFASSVVVLGNTLYFTATVWNYGETPIRTTGPYPGYVYGAMGENYSATGFLQESGAFRLGLMCDTCQNDFPWRWGLGSPETLTLITDANGRPHYYLMPGERAVITGGVVLDNIVERRNPQFFWAGLIHEDVRILNNRADQQLITIEPAGP